MVGSLLSRNLADRCCFNCHKYFSLYNIKFIFVCLILTIFPCVHAFMALLTNLVSRKLAETAALTLIFLQIVIFIINVNSISFENVQYFSLLIFIIVGNLRGVTAHINLHCDHQQWQKYWNCHHRIINNIVSIVLCFIFLVIFTHQHLHYHQHRH